MKNQLVKALCALSLPLALLAGCGIKQGPAAPDSPSSGKTTAEYKITQFFGDDDAIKEYIQNIRDAGICESISLADNNKYIVVTATEDQRKDWVSTAAKTISDTIRGVAADDHYSIDCEDDYTKLIISATRDWDTRQLALDLALVLYNMEIYQIFSGSPDWGVDLLVVDSESQKTLYEAQYPENEIDFGDALWESAD